MMLRSLRRRRIMVATLAIVLALASIAAAQRRRFFYGWDETVKNIPYDGRFTWVRIRYTPAPGGYWAGGQPSWVHGYPLAEQNLMRIMKEITLLDLHQDDVDVMTLDDPELCKYPFAYIIEVGWWTATEREVIGLRNYLQKGGFLFVDDFKPDGWRGLQGGGWKPFEDTIKRVLPEARIVDLNVEDKIFHSFFEIKDETLTNFPQAYNYGPPVFRGVYEDNDPHKRLMMIINYNTDVSQFWEWSGRGFRPFDDTSEAYKLGVNYLMYGMTH
jgi:Domain of unknown function (DUF4159)